MFLYIIQVAECIRNDVLAGMGNNESHDILALSYKSVCSLNTFEHVRYITAGYKTTWTSGRNLLYRYISNQSQHMSYLYYTFMDEDIILIHNDIPASLSMETDEKWTEIRNSTNNLYKKYENFLYKYRPAVGVLDGINIRHFWPHSEKQPLSPYVSCFYFDAMFNSFHKDVIHKLLPYDESFDSESWWISQQVMQCKVYVRYYSQMIMFLPILAVNDQHSSYPQNLRHSGKTCINELDAAPANVRASPRAQIVLNAESQFSFPHLNPSPPRTPILEYVQFANNS